MKAFDETWDEIHKNMEWGKYPAEYVIRFIARNYYAKKREEISVLDFGCGAGAHTWYLAREGFQTFAFDGSKHAVERVLMRLENDNLSADVRVMDGISLGYEDEKFDSIVDNVCIYANLLEHIKTMYSEAYRCLKKGGKMITSAFSTNTSGYGTGEKIEENTYRDITEGNLAGRGICHFYAEGELEEILKQVGFKNIIVEPMEYVDRGNKVGMWIVQAEK